MKLADVSANYRAALEAMVAQGPQDIRTAEQRLEDAREAVRDARNALSNVKAGHDWAVKRLAEITGEERS